MQARVLAHAQDALLFFFSSRRRHTRSLCDWSSDVCSSDLHCCIHMHTVMATVFSCDVNMFACTPTKSCTAVAWLGLLGSLDSLSPVRKLPQPEPPSTRQRETAATLIERVMGRSPRANGSR